MHVRHTPTGRKVTAVLLFGAASGPDCHEFMDLKARLTTLPPGSIAVGGSKLHACRATSTILSILAAIIFPRPALAVELTEPLGAAHAYPALLDTNGKKLADGEFRQWIEDGSAPG